MEREEALDEEWRIVEDYHNYSISNYGRIKNTTTDKILKPKICANGRLVVVLCNGNGHKNVLIHKLVADAFLDKIDNKTKVDHIDCNQLNNHIDNLRYVTSKENSQNRGSNRETTSKYKGVSFYTANNKWKAHIMLDGKKIHLGYFTSEKDAAKAYNAKAKELSEFLKLNDISDDEEAAVVESKC